MGYGHQRAAYPLLDLSGGEAIIINDYEGIAKWEEEYWINSQSSYDKISRFKKFPVIGKLVFSVMDKMQEISPFYPKRNLSTPSLQQKFFYNIVKRGLGKNLIDKLSNSGLPFVTTFFVAAYIADYWNYPEDIYCIICDTDVSRAWAPLNPQTSRVKYLVPSEKVKERLAMYGTRPENIIISGFPLPTENIGDRKEILGADLARRLSVLDKDSSPQTDYHKLLDFLSLPEYSTSKNPLAITFAVGGAGAQKEIGALILNKLAAGIKKNMICLNLIAGNRPEVKEYFEKEIEAAGLSSEKNVRVVFAPEKNEYFRQFNKCLRQTDVLWTKPSELSFYCALGLPIIISSTVGSQEDFNREWLLSIGAGIDSPDPEFVAEWLPDLLESGQLARAAVAGALNAEQMGAYNIKKILLNNV